MSAAYKQFCSQHNNNDDVDDDDDDDDVDYNIDETYVESPTKRENQDRRTSPHHLQAAEAQCLDCVTRPAIKISSVQRREPIWKRALTFCCNWNV